MGDKLRLDRCRRPPRQVQPATGEPFLPHSGRWLHRDGDSGECRRSKTQAGKRTQHVGYAFLMSPQSISLPWLSAVLSGLLIAGCARTQPSPPLAGSGDAAFGQLAAAILEDHYKRNPSE